MPPIRTLFAATTLTMGGAERVIEELVTRLDRTKFDVELLTLRDPGRIGSRLSDSGIRLHQGWTDKRKFDPLLIPRLHGWLRRERFEILYFLDHPHTIFHGTIASWATSVRVRVMPVHTTGRWGGERSVPRSVRLFLPWLDAVIAIASAQRDYLIREEGLPEAKLVVIPNGIRVEQPDLETRRGRREAIRSQLGIGPDVPVAMILAVLRPEKNHELLLRSIARVVSRMPELLLLVVGDGPRRQELEAEARALGLGSAVRFLGAQADGRRFWAAADLAVLCSHPRVETLPLSLLEAMDAALPIVGTDVGAMREIVQPGCNGELVAAGDEAALAEKIETILLDRTLSLAYGSASQERVAESYRVEQMVEATEQLLLKLHGGDR